jgi:hypothetical protein
MAGLPADRLEQQGAAGDGFTMMIGPDTSRGRDPPRRSAVELGNPTGETDSMAEGAVGREPVSTSNSLLTGNLTGKFWVF